MAASVVIAADVHRRRRHHAASSRTTPAAARRLDVDELPVGRARSAIWHRPGAWRSFPACRVRAAPSSRAMAMRVDRAAAAEFTFFLAMPTMARGVRARSVRRRGTSSAPARGVEIAIGFVMAFVSLRARREAVSQLRPAIGLPGVRVVPHRRSGVRRCLAAICGRLDVGT